MASQFLSSRSGFNMVRWLVIVAVCCCCSFLLALVIVNLVPAREPRVFEEVIISHPSHREFKLSEGPLQHDVQQVITSQLSAFRQDNYPQAFTYAATGIRSAVSLQSFEQMVRTSYPAIARSKTAEFGSTMDDGQIAVISVTVVGDAGETHHYRYFLQREKTGWKISGVSEVKPEGTLI